MELSQDFVTAESVARVLVGILFALTALGKWLNLRWFMGIFRNYRLVPDRVAHQLAVAVVLVESVVAVLLLTDTWTPLSTYVAGAVTVMFTAAITINLVRGRTEIQCGCFGPSGGERLSWHLVVRNVGLIVLTWLATGHLSSSSVSAAAILVLALAMMGGAVTLLRLHRRAEGFVRTSAAQSQKA